MDYQTFRTRALAKHRLATMRGWDAQVQRIDLGDGKRAWVIACRIGPEDWRYLRQDGFVR